MYPKEHEYYWAGEIPMGSINVQPNPDDSWVGG